MAVKRKTGRPVKVEGEKSTKEKIFDAAVDLFAEKGYDGVSIRDIAKAVGIKESSVYKHYRSKDEILDTIFEYMKARLYPSQTSGSSMVTMLDALTFEQVLESGYASLGRMMADPLMLKITRIITIELYRNEKIREFFYSQMFERPVDDLELLFRRLMDKKKIKAYDPRALATTYFAFSVYMHMETFLLRYEQGLDAKLIENKSRAHMKLFVDMLKPEGN
jgi:AcrR family transcriptional regulator